jgi:hypothetical protein
MIVVNIKKLSRLAKIPIVLTDLGFVSVTSGTDTMSIHPASDQNSSKEDIVSWG